jgi:hypothetical protein
MTTVLASIVWAILSLGIVPVVFTGFLRAGDLHEATVRLEAQIAKVDNQVASNARDDKAYRAAQLRSAIIDAQTRRCKAKNDEGKLVYTRLIDGMLDQYRAITSGDYQVPSCADL